MKKDEKITKHNYDEMMPGASISFQGLIASAYCPHREGHISGATFGLNRYLYYDDITILMEKRIKSHQSRFSFGGANAVKNINKWKAMFTLATKMKEEEN